MDIAVRNRNHRTATGNHMPCGITHPAAATFPPLPQPKLVLDLATPEGHKAELTYCMMLKEDDLICRIVSVRETRITGIISHVFIGLSLLFIDQLQLIPRPVLDGLFLYLAVTALHCNQLFERIMLLVTEQVRLTSNLIIIIIIIIIMYIASKLCTIIEHTRWPS